MTRQLKDDVGQLETTFAEYATISGLALHLGKTCIVPLKIAEEQEFRGIISSEAPSWGGVRISYTAEYLGFRLGPGDQHASWYKPLEKYTGKAVAWSKTGCGFQLACLAYPIYIISALSFVAQLCNPPTTMASH